MNNFGRKFTQTNRVGTFIGEHGCQIEFFFAKELMACECRGRRYLIPYETERERDGKLTRTVHATAATLEGSVAPLSDFVVDEIREAIRAAASVASLECRFK